MKLIKLAILVIFLNLLFLNNSLNASSLNISLPKLNYLSDPDLNIGLIELFPLTIFQEEFKNKEINDPVESAFSEELFESGVIFYKGGRLDDALKEFIDLTKITNSYSVLYNIGTIYFKKKNYIEAGESYRKAIAIKDDLGEAYNNIGLIKYIDLQGNLSSLQEGLNYLNIAKNILCKDNLITKECAITNFNLGIITNTIPQITGESSEEYIEKSIPYFEKALEFFKEEDYPKQRAFLHFILGSNISNKRSGDLQSNLGKAINHYKEAMKFFTKDSFPLLYGLINYNMAEALSIIASNDSTGNYHEMAIKAFEIAQRIFKEENIKEYYLSSLSSIGDLYVNMPTGDKKHHLSQAIERYTIIVKSINSKEYSESYAKSLYILGTLYNIAGSSEKELPNKKPTFIGCSKYLPSSRTKYFNNAISLFQDLLPLWNKKDYPLKFAMVNESLGDSYSGILEYGLFKYKRKGNLKKGLSYYEEAFNIYKTLNNERYNEVYNKYLSVKKELDNL